jgi:hypothetical protein
MPFDVICPECRLCFFETNDKDGFNPHVTGIKSQFVRIYDPDAMANAAMIRMKDKFIGIYDDIPHDADLFSEGIGPCPGCGNALSNDGFKLITRPRKPEEKERETDILNNFFTDRCILDSDARVTAKEIFEKFTYWIQISGEKQISKKAFGIALKQKGFDSGRASGGTRIWKGLTLKRDAK